MEITNYYSFLKEYSPCEIGAFINTIVDYRGIAALVTDLAIKGYLKIIKEDEKKFFFKKRKKFKLERTDKKITDLKDFEKRFLEVLFDNDSQKEIRLYKVGDKFRFRKAANILNDIVIEGKFVKNGLYKINPEKIRYLLRFIGGVLMIILLIGTIFFKIDPIFLLGFMIIFGIVLIIEEILPKRTSKGKEINRKILEFEKFIKKGKGTNFYIINNDKENLTLFENILPYTITLNMEKYWIEKSKNIILELPSWYKNTKSINIKNSKDLLMEFFSDMQDFPKIILNVLRSTEIT